MAEAVTNNSGDILRHTDPHEDWRPPVICDEKQTQLIEAHVEQYLGPVQSVFHEILSDALHIDLLWVAPTEQRPYHTLVTMGMSALPMQTPPEIDHESYAELMIKLPAEWPMDEKSFENERHYWPLYWLKMLARMPVNYDTWLGYGHSIPNGDPAEPLADNTRLCGVVLTPPLEDESFSRLTIDDERTVYFWNLAPVYAEEMNFKLAQGADALLDRFSAADISDVVDVDRKNVCKKKRFGIF